MKNLIAIPLVMALSVLLLSAFTYKELQQTDWGDCLVKYKSAWGEPTSRCTSPDTYKVWLRNGCTESIDVMVCVQEEDKTWRPFSHNGMAPKDSMVVYACKGTGKYLYWARKKGDDTVVFPTIEQINKKYSD